jgi:hypothetical protein
MGDFLRALRRAVAVYPVVGLLLVAFSAWSFNPLSGTGWQERAASAVEDILTWPRMLPEAAAAMDLPLPGLY